MDASIWPRASVGKTIDKILSHWNEIENIVAERKATRGRSGFGGTARSGASDPTASEAIRQADEIKSVTCADGFCIKWPESWLGAFDEAYSRLDGITRDIMRRRYQRNEGYVKTSIALNVSERTYYSVVDDIKSYVVIVAIQHGLVQVR